MKRWTLTGAGLLVVVAAAAFTFSGGGSEDDSPPSPPAALVVPPAQVGEQPAGPIAAEEPMAEPEGDLVLAAPAGTRAGASTAFAATWSSEAGDDVTGEVELQRIEGKSWTTVSTLATEAGVGTAHVEVPSSGLYRLAYGGSEKLSAVSSPEVMVTAGELMPSQVTITVTPGDDGTADVAAAWTTGDEVGVPIVGDLVVQAAQGEEWAPLAVLTTAEDGTGRATVEVHETARLRVAYDGGARFAAVASAETLALGDDVRTVPVTTCDDEGDIDRLAYGSGCRYLPVEESGTFVVGHDFYDNAWWNSAPKGTYIQLSGENAGLYEVVDRVFAPGRGKELGSASNWACGDECDVILQTCKGARTGFTWLRRVDV